MTEGELAAALARGGSGKVRVLFEVDCRLCPESAMSLAWEKKYAEKEFRLWNWSKTTRFGWVCPDCAAKLKART